MELYCQATGIIISGLIESTILSNTNLSSANLRRINLNSASLSCTNLSHTNFDNTNLSNLNLSNLNLSYSNLRSADLRNTNFCNADLSYADLSNTNLSNTNLSYANLSNTNLSYAELSNTNLSHANLSHFDLNNFDLSYADLSYADLSYANLSYADLNDTDLSYADLSYANLSYANLSNTNLSNTNLSNTNLNNTNLRYADLSYADLSNTNLSNTNLSNFDLNNFNLSNSNLSNVNLRAVKALATNFSGAILTGACIEDWHINAQTNLQRVKCDYIYLGYDETQEEFCDRHPRAPERIFSPGEFTERYQKALDTVDLFFADGIDWKAFLVSFQELQSQFGEENLEVQGFERKGQGFEVRLAVSSDLDKAEIERNALQKYETQLQLTEARYRGELHAKDREIEIYKKQSADMLGLAKLAASKPIIVDIQANAVADNQSNNTSYNLQGSKFGGGFAAEGGIQIGGQLIDASQQQDLVAAADEIQKLLSHLSETYPTTTSAEQMIVAMKAVEAIEKNPSLKQRVIGALKSGSIETLKTLVDHPAMGIVLAAVQGWQNP